MAKLVQCIPNFSEGRNDDTIRALVETATGVTGVNLIDHSSDINHNRSVLTLIGDPGSISEAAFRLCKTASERIDMTKHTGAHPRIGATDVIPFVPVRDCTVAECVEMSKAVAKRIWDELLIPSFLYENSCTNEARRDLANVRKGGFEGMPEKLLLEGWAPDFGTRRIHPTAGVTAIGARPPLVAFNVNLGTSDIGIANSIAKTIRASNGGLRYCKAIGVRLADRNIVQVSMNITNFEGTPIYRVFELVSHEARRRGVEVVGSELIGVVPARVFIDCAESFLQIENFNYHMQVLENHLIE